MSQASRMEEGGDDPVRWPVAGWIIWMAIVAFSGLFLIDQTAKIQPDSTGLDYFSMYMAWAHSGTIVAASGCVTVLLSTRSHINSGLLALGLTAIAWMIVLGQMRDIEFVRTPPCWGMHSEDPGSGESCPAGMRKDFTLAELREYYRTERK